MRFVVLLLSLLALAQGETLGSRIINGVNVKLGEISYQVSLQIGYVIRSHYCGGSIINENYVVTAAHCVKGRSKSIMRVVVGTVSLKEAEIKHKVEKYIVHEGYDPSRIQNDIGLIKVTTPFKFTKFVQPVALPEFNFVIKPNSTVTVSGWGFVSTSKGKISNELKKANILVADQDYCSYVMKKVGKEIFSTNICANDPITKRGQCSGDSGGPLTSGGILVGIVSWSIKDPDCGSTYYSGVYTRVSQYVDWFERKMD